MSDIQADIKTKVDANPVMLFMKGTPQFPQCGFSSVVVQILDHLGVDFETANVLESDDLRNGIKEFFRLANDPATLRQRRVCRRLRHHQGNVRARRVA